MATTRGIDVSAYQSPQNWSAHKREGVSFAFAKASEGLHTRDSRFATHIKGIKAAGLVAGAYHFAWPAQSAAQEAANYIAAVRPYAGAGFCHWLDLERYSDGRNYGGRSASQIRAYVSSWLSHVRDAFPGQRAGVYTSRWDLSSGHVPDGVTIWYPEYPWSSGATYARAEAHARPTLPAGHGHPLFWQFTGSPLDRSIAYLSAADLRAWAHGAATDPEDDEVPYRTSLGKNKEQPLPWNEFTPITWNLEYGGLERAHADGDNPGYIALASSWADFNGRIVVRGTRPGDSVQVQYEVHTWQDGKSTHTWREIILDHASTTGDDFLVVPFSKGLDKGQHVYVSLKPIPAGGDPADRTVPVAVGGRWAIRQDVK
jgi:GH25 family lysozyme M1 (1,4-beta-N-acetylmuramidase)